MSKFLLLLGIGIFIWFLWRARLRRGDMAEPARERPVESMVQCAHCGVHLPLSDSIPDGPHYFCCEAHRRQFR